MTNDNVKIGLITFDSDGEYHGMYAPLNSNNNGRNTALESKLKSLQSTTNDYKGYTNFDDGLDKSIDFFMDPNLPGGRKNLLIFLSDGNPNVKGDGDAYSPACISSHPLSSFSNLLSFDGLHSLRTRIGAPQTKSRSSINQIMYILTEDSNKPWEKGALSFCMPGHSNKCESNKIECARNNARSPGGCLGANPATDYVSELAKLDELKVARMAIGVGGGSGTTHGSALWMIDNSPAKNTINPAQVSDNDALVTAVTSVNVCAEIARCRPRNRPLLPPRTPLPRRPRAPLLRRPTNQPTNQLTNQLTNH
jgi:hypothetical protein